MRCPDCNKFAAFETCDPEVDLTIEGLTVRATIRIALQSECCSTELKEGSFEPEVELDPALFKGHIDPVTLEPWTSFEDDAIEHDLQVDETDVEMSERTEKRVTFYGAHVGYAVRCACQDKTADPLYEGTFNEEMPAGDMEECC